LAATTVELEPARGPKISVVVTCYNHSKYLIRCLESVLHQTGAFDLEVIIGDDCSTDNSQQIIEEYQMRYPSIVRVVPSERNVGMLRNLKRCFEMCTGEYVAICEGDDFWFTDRKLSKQLDFLRARPDCSMCFNWILLCDEDSQRHYPHHEQGLIVGDHVTFRQLAKAPATANFTACFYRAETVRRIPETYYDEPGAAEWLFNLYAAQQGNVGFLREFLSVYTLHAHGQWSGLSEAERSERIRKGLQRLAEIFGSGRGFDHVTVRHQVRLVDPGGAADLLKFFLDQPVDGSTKEIETGDFEIQGWAISNSSQPLHLLTRQSGVVTEQEMNIERRDVIAAVLGDPSLHDSRLKCGFSVAIPYAPNTFVELGARIGNELRWFIEIETRKIEAGLPAGAFSE
jgi:glycosyltransferase involved in cell wall biosynthesis